MSETKAGDIFVVGFVFSLDSSNVLLIRKTHPTWQKGKLNGIGGKVEKGEIPAAAMSRECFEECGLHIKLTDWQRYVTLKDRRGWRIDFYFTRHQRIGDAESTTDELVEIIDVRSLGVQSCIPNLRWLIPMALTMKDESCEGFLVEEI